MSQEDNIKYNILLKLVHLQHSGTLNPLELIVRHLIEDLHPLKKSHASDPLI